MEKIQIRLVNGENPEQEPSQVYEIPEETTLKQLNALVNKLIKQKMNLILIHFIVMELKLLMKYQIKVVNKLGYVTCLHN